MGIKDSFENVVVNGVHASRYIASWFNIGGGKVKPGRNGWKGSKLAEWLFSIGVNEDDAYRIYLLATNGRLELETSVKKFLAKNSED